VEDVSFTTFSHNAQRHRQTDRLTDDIVMPIADHTQNLIHYKVVVYS